MVPWIRRKAFKKKQTSCRKIYSGDLIYSLKRRRKKPTIGIQQCNQVCLHHCLMLFTKNSYLTYKGALLKLVTLQYSTFRTSSILFFPILIFHLISPSPLTTYAFSHCLHLCFHKKLVSPKLKFSVFCSLFVSVLVSAYLVIGKFQSWEGLRPPVTQTKTRNQL